MEEHLRSPLSEETIDEIPPMGDGSGLAPDERYYTEEIQLALRNHGLPLEALRYPITPLGLHYVLIHWDIPAAEDSSWQLAIGGRVRQQLQLSIDDLRSRTAVNIPITLECAGNGRALMEPRSLSQPWLYDAVGTAEWTGTPLKGVLEEAGIDDGAIDVLFTGADWGIQGNEVQPYQRSLSVDEATRDGVLLAYEMNGQPLSPQHGYPLRLVVPDWYGMTSVKWLTRIDVLDEPFDGYQMSGTYRYTQTVDDPGEPVTFKQPRALMIPPGIPDFASRLRVMKAGQVTLAGRAWAGRAEITKVEVSMDGGATWADAELEEPVSPFAWRGWSFDWNAQPGQHTLCVRATDSDGQTQPMEQPWNYQGMGNNIIQRVNVLVR